jgi:hypothetical protein
MFRLILHFNDIVDLGELSLASFKSFDDALEAKRKFDFYEAQFSELSNVKSNRTFEIKED